MAFTSGGSTTQRASAGSWPARPNVGQRRERAVDALRREPARSLETEERRIRRFAGGGVLAGGLAQLVRGAFDVQDVIDDLKRQADVFAA